MPYWNLLTICVSLILGIGSVATIFVNGWVKASHLGELKLEVDKLWEKVTRIEVLSIKLEAIEKNINEIKEMIREQRDK